MRPQSDHNYRLAQLGGFVKRKMQKNAGSFLQHAADTLLTTVILSEAKNLGSCNFNELRGSFVAHGSSG